MKKIHTRIKRKFGLSTGKNWYYTFFHKNLIEKKRPKTFKTEESAKKWAEAQGLKKFELKNIRIGTKDKKIRVITL